MSQQPPPYGGPPGPYPPAPYDHGQPHDGLSNKAKFWIGVALTIPTLILAGIVSGAASAATEGVGGDASAGAAVAGVVGLLELGVFVAAVIIEKTRWFALGILAGTAILLILAAGACVVLIIGLSQGFS
jgi:hypothetical protein